MKKIFFFLITLLTIQKIKTEDPLYNFLLKKISGSQHKKEKAYKNFFSLHKKKGLYESFTKLNLSGNFFFKFIRNIFGVDDNNMFVTTFIIRNYLELYNMNEINISKNEIKTALENISDFKDKNYPDFSFYGFWEQKKNKKKTFSQHPSNILNPINSIFNIGEKIVSFLKFFRLNWIAEKLENLIQSSKDFFLVFHLPSDVDDTSMNISIGNLLSQMNNDFPELVNIFDKNNPNIKGTFEKISEFNYKPFEDSDSNVQDARSFYFMKDYLDEIANKKKNYDLNKKSKEDLNEKNIEEDFPNPEFTSTWISNTSISKKNYPLIQIPGSINNIDLCVISNYLIAFTGFALYKDISVLENKKLLFVYKENLKLIFWALKNNKIFKRFDIGLLYYPNVYTFYWFISKVFALINNYEKTLPEFFLGIKDYLQKMLETYGVDQMMENRIEKKENIYWEGFLGKNDRKGTGEDRLFNTALALNFFFNVYSETIPKENQKKNCKFIWKSNLTKKNKKIMKKGINFLRNEIGKNNLKKENSFFSGSVKSMGTLWYNYPANFAETIDGAKISNLHNNPEVINTKLIYGIKGFIEKNKYNDMKDEVWILGEKFIKEFTDLNSSPFPYWSSPALTYSVNLLAIAKFNHLERCSS